MLPDTLATCCPTSQYLLGAFTVPAALTACQPDLCTDSLTRLFWVQRASCHSSCCNRCYNAIKAPPCSSYQLLLGLAHCAISVQYPA